MYVLILNKKLILGKLKVKLEPKYDKLITPKTFDNFQFVRDLGFLKVAKAPKILGFSRFGSLELKLSGLSTIQIKTRLKK